MRYCLPFGLALLIATTATAQTTNTTCSTIGGFTNCTSSYTPSPLESAAQGYLLGSLLGETIRAARAEREARDAARQEAWLARPATWLLTSLAPDTSFAVYADEAHLLKTGRHTRAASAVEVHAKSDTAGAIVYQYRVVRADIQWTRSRRPRFDFSGSGSCRPPGD